MARDSDGIRKRIAFEQETFNALDCLAKDRVVTLQDWRMKPSATC
jgi:hypothetical protein